jgi:hypothetical protein
MPLSQTSRSDVSQSDKASTVDVSSVPNSRPLSPTAAKKVTYIEDACRDEDLDALIDLATTNGGLVKDSLRRTACRNTSHTGSRPHTDLSQGRFF